MPAAGMPPSLRDLQLWLRWVITDPRGVDSALSEPPPAGERYQPPAVNTLAWIEERAPLTRNQRLDIYAEGYFARIVDALAQTYARTSAVLGEPDFRKLVAEYLKVYPSRTHDIDQVGRFLLTFVTQTEPWLNAESLHDLIRAERLAHESFLSSVEPAADISARADELAAADPARLHLRVNRGLRLLASAWNLDELWQGGAARMTDDIETYLILGWSLRRLTAFERSALVRLTEGASLAEMLADANAAPEDVQAAFTRWWLDGIVVDFRA